MSILCLGFPPKNSQTTIERHVQTNLIDVQEAISPFAPQRSHDLLLHADPPDIRQDFPLDSSSEIVVVEAERGYGTTARFVVRVPTGSPTGPTNTMVSAMGVSVLVVCVMMIDGIFGLGRMTECL